MTGGEFLVRKNNKEQLVSYENSIKKSNDFSMSKLSQGLTLNQMQLLAYAIYATQQDGKTEFRKHEFQSKFELDHYKTEEANADSKKLYELGFSTVDLENNKFDYLRVFQRIKYDNGAFSFKWTDDMVPQILELKTYSLIDLTITSKFKSSFSWTLYEFLKAHYGNWHKTLSKDALMKLFGVEDRKTYQKSTAQFKRGVLDVAVEEINEHTELEVWYTEKRVGNKINSFILHWSTGKSVPAATEKQVTLLREIHDEVEKNLITYLSIENIESARANIIAIKNIYNELEKGLSSKKADEYIQQSLMNYKQLEQLVEMNGKKRDTSVYYNWLEEIGE